jgi:hypothetical protein
MTPRAWMLLVVLAGCDSWDDDYVEPPPGPPPVAHDDSATVAEDSTNQLTRHQLLENDENFTYGTKVTFGAPAHGTWTSTTVNGVSTDGYIPDPGYHGPDQFTYELTSAHDETSTATVTINVTSDGIRYEDSIRLDDSEAADVAVGDVDGDGKLDVVVVSPLTSNIVVLANRTVAAGQFAAEVFRFEGGHEPKGVAIVDLDADGRLDVVTAARTDGLIVLRNITSPGGPLAFAAPLSVPSGDAIAVAALDLNADGQADLVALDGAGDALQVRINTSTPGTLGFGVRTTFATPRGPIELLASDADGDGALDLAVLSYTAGALSLFVNATAIGNTVPAFAARVDRATGTKPASMFLADLDGDAKDELAVLHESDALWIYANRSVGSGPPMYEAARVQEYAFQGVALAAPFDLDGQGPIDVLVAASGTAPAVQLVNQSAQPGSYLFATVDSRPADVATRKRQYFGYPSGLVRADLDGVGPAEIVLTTHGSTGSGTNGTFVLFDR